MIIWVSKKAACANTDQRTEVIATIGNNLRVRLLGTNEQLDIKTQDVTGVEINDHLTIRFQYTGHISMETMCLGCN